MISDGVYELCLPTLQDDALDEDDKTEKIEQLLRRETELAGKELESATLDILWRYRNVSNPAATSAVRQTMIRRHTPVQLSASRSGTPLTSSPRSTAASPAPSSFGTRPALLRMKSSQQSPFTSPRSSPRLAQVIPSLQSPASPQNTFFDKDPGPDNFGEYGNDGLDWGNEDTTSNASSGYGGDWNSIPEFQPQTQMNDMSPYDMLRSVIRGQKTDEEIESLLEANGYDMSAAIMSLMDAGGQDSGHLSTALPEQDRTFLVGKSMTPGSRPGTPAGQGKSPVICRYWLSTGQCLRADCKFSHDLSNHVCKYWLQGNCLAGDSCIFSHDPSALLGSMSLTDPTFVSTPPLEAYNQGVQIGDYSSFPTLGNGAQQPLGSDLKSLYPGAEPFVGTSSFSPRPGLAPEFVPSRPQSRPTSRHQSPGRHSSRLSAEDNDAFPTLGSPAFRGTKKHHGKRGHGHGHREKENVTNSLADVLRNSSSPNPQAIATPRRGFRSKHGQVESREYSAAAIAIPPPEHIPWLETGDRANKEYLKARQAAIRHGGARNKFLQSAAQAWNRNDVRAAKALSLRGQSENDLMREAHRSAARHLYDLRNRSHGVNSSDDEVYVDLHGLHPSEAVSYLDTALKNQRSASKVHRERNSILYAIVGTGHHSKGGRDKVGKAIRSYLNDARYAFREFSVAGSASSGGSGGILGIDASSGGKVREGKIVDDDGQERIEDPMPPEHGKIRILKAEDVKPNES